MNKPDTAMFDRLSEKELLLNTIEGRRFLIDPSDLPEVLCWIPTDSVEINPCGGSEFIIRRVCSDEQIRVTEI